MRKRKKFRLFKKRKPSLWATITKKFRRPKRRRSTHR